MFIKVIADKKRKKKRENTISQTMVLSLIAINLNSITLGGNLIIVNSL